MSRPGPLIFSSSGGVELRRPVPCSAYEDRMAVQAQRNARPKTTESRAAHKLNFELTARRLVATNISDALRCATDIRERIVS